MLNNHDPIATVGVKDLSVAAEFYEKKLGLKKLDHMSEAITFQSGSSKMFVYRSAFAGTNMATAVTWTVGGEIEEIVSKLRGNGITFEHYDMPGMTREGDLHVAGQMKAAWFKDPDGNILGLVNG